MKKINTVFIVMCLLFITACGFNPKMTYITSSPGYLTSIKKINNLDTKASSLLNNFALDLYYELLTEGDNIFISPASIYLALGMTYNGAGGATLEEMSTVIGANNISQEEFNKLNRDLQYLILGYEKSKFELANSIWIRDTYEKFVKEDFLNRNKDYYGAMISALDFSDPRAKNTINNWVNKNTKGRIKKAIDNDIHPLTVMFLINTIYFKADWKNPFEKINTYDGDFHTYEETKSIKLMNKIDSLGYIDDNDLQGVMMPYSDDKTSMMVLLPKENIKDISLTTNNINQWINEMKSNKVDINLTMPKITMEYETSLKDSLSMLGMANSFTGLADFSNMADNAEEQGLHIADITHKSFLAIDEKGTEAAAMTKVEMRLESSPISEITLNINRPFIFAIIDNESSAILFLGTIYNPKQ